MVVFQWFVVMVLMRNSIRFLGFWFHMANSCLHIHFKMYSFCDLTTVKAHAHRTRCHEASSKIFIV